MNEIVIAVNFENDRPTVSGRELHAALEVKTSYKDWFPRMCEYGFVEGKDFNPLKIDQVKILKKRKAFCNEIKRLMCRREFLLFWRSDCQQYINLGIKITDRRCTQHLEN